MTKYMLSVHSVAGASRPPMTDEQVQTYSRQIGAVEEQMSANRALLFSGRLDEPARAKVVRISRGDRQTTDGPFAEA